MGIPMAMHLADTHRPPAIIIDPESINPNRGCEDNSKTLYLLKENPCKS